MSDIDEYIQAFPPDVQQVLQKMRTTVAKAVPRAQEKISPSKGARRCAGGSSRRNVLAVTACRSPFR